MIKVYKQIHSVLNRSTSLLFPTRSLKHNCFYTFSNDNRSSQGKSNNQKQQEDDDTSVIIVENKENQKIQSEYFKQVDYVAKQKFLEQNFYSLITVGASVLVGSIYENIYLLTLSLPGIYKLGQSERILLKTTNILKQKLFNYDSLYKSFNIMLINKLCHHTRVSKYFTQDTLCIKDSLISIKNKDGKKLYIYEFTFFDLKSGAFGEVKCEIEYSDEKKFASRQIEISFDFPEKCKAIIEDPEHTINIF